MKPHRANKSTSSLGAAGTGTGTGANGTGASTTSLVPSPIATSCPGTPMQDTFAAPRPSTSSIQSATADGGNGSGSASASRLRRSFTFDRRSFDLTSFFSSNGSGSGSADRGTHVGSGGGSLGGNENAGGTMALGSADALRIGMLERGVWHVFHTPGMAHNCLVGGLARYEQQRTELWKKIAETVKDLDMAAAAAKLSAATTTSPSTLSSPTSSPTV
ncbi:hypothetical protein FRC20_002614 [Serendipita sp. 405]|nr:hypothetical protein FRC20_002614 [Serendipita sp. 405]